MEQKNILAKTVLPKENKVPWNQWIGVLYVLAIYLVSQIVGLVLTFGTYQLVSHIPPHVSSGWVTNSIYAQFIYVVIVEAFTVLATIKLVKFYKISPRIIGLRRPRLNDVLYGLSAVPAYYIIYFVAIGCISYFYKGLNVDQKQNVGFSGSHGPAELVITFISLVVLPPIAEEILVRGFLYSSLKKGLPLVWAAIVTSLIFASAHLSEGVGGLLWIGFIDTFTLSMVLVYLREKSEGLYAGMTLHGIKNFIAFYAIYLSPLIRLHF